MKRNEIHEGSIFISFEKIYELYWAGPCPLCLGFAGDGSCRARPEEPEAQYDYDETACTRWTSPANSPPPYAAQLMPYRQKNMTAQGPLSSDTALESCTSSPPRCRWRTAPRRGRRPARRRPGWRRSARTRRGLINNSPILLG